MSKPKILDKWVTSLVLVAVVGVAALGIYQFGIKPGLPEETYAPINGEEAGEDKPFAFDSIDSSSCVACHTNESVIAASTWGQDKPVAENTGG